MKIKLLLFFCLFLLIFSFNQSFSQTAEDIYVKKSFLSWKDFSTATEENYNVTFYFYNDSIPNIPIDVKTDSILLEQLLNDSFLKYGIRVSTDGIGNYFLFKNFSVDTTLDLFLDTDTGENSTNGVFYSQADEEFLKTYDHVIPDQIIVGSNGTNHKNKKVKLSGYVTNSSDGTTIPQARIKINESNITTDISGYYEIRLKPGNYNLTVNSLGMYEKSYNLILASEGQLNVPLKTKSFLLNEAIISADINHNVKSTAMGFEKITSKSIKELPVILGEQDIVKVALMLPGVQTVGEVSSGFNVRGSPADQNMFYINNLPVYNSSHLFGLYTTFNSDAINEFKFYKSNIPIEYGGHLSSIFDIQVKNGNYEKFSARGGIGPLSSRAMVEGPILSDSSSSYLISVRSTYSDWLLKQIKNVDIQNSAASFYDALMNFSFQANKKNKINIFLYGSNDFADLAFGIKNNYQNLGIATKWSHSFNKKLNSEVYFTKSRYYYDLESYEIDYLGYKNSFELNHTEAKLKFKYFLSDKQDIQFGVNAKLYHLNYGDLLPLNDKSEVKPLEFESEKAVNASVFISDNWDISDKLSVQGGVRATYYAFLGPKIMYDYIENSPREAINIKDTLHYAKNKIISDNFNLDFRIAGKYEIIPGFSVKAGYNILHQYISMLSNSVSVSPTNKWKLSDPNIKPLKGEQYSLGFYKNFRNNTIETSVEMYYKEIENQVEYKDGADFITSQFPETEIIQGNINAYGIEFMVKGTIGKLNGWLNYTYSKAEVKAIDSRTGEMNNFGKVYPANYDKPHAVNLALSYKATKRISFSTNIVYSTGRPITYPTSLYYLNDQQVIGFSERNEYRLPDYFRADLSINIEGNLKKNKFAHGSWSIGFYNLTSRKNPYSIVFQNEDGVIKGYEISILGAIIPSISYNLKFGNYED